MKLFLLLLTIPFFLYSCSKDDVVKDEKEEEEEVGIIVTYEKKGACLTTSGLLWSSRVSKLKPYWHYSWGTDLKEGEPDNVEYVPMFWGKQVSDEKVAYLKDLASQGKINYILGFNEPDGEEQANMTVDEAIALWPKLEEIGVPIGSPAPVGGANAWMTEFMQKAEAQNLRIDFIAMHRYPGPNADAFLNKVKEIHELYKLPIWITEFGVADWNASSVEDNKYSPSQVLTFMKAVLPALDELDYVHRYAWFSGQLDNKALAPSALFDVDDNLTALGRFYARHTPNEETGPGMEPQIYSNIEGNLIPNGNFGDYHVYGEPDANTAESVGWFGFQIDIEPSDAVEGYAGILKNGWSGNAAFNNKFGVEAGKTYAISFYVKWLGKDGSIKMTFKDDDDILDWEEAGKPSASKPPILESSPEVEADPNGNNEWTLVSFEYTVPEGISNLRLTLWKAEDTSTCLIDEVFAKEI